MPSRVLGVDVIADAKGFKKALGEADRSTRTFGISLRSLAKGGIVAAAAIGATGLVAGLKSSIGAAKDAEAAQARLRAALDNANVSFRKHGEAIQDAIDKTSKLAAFDDEDLSDSFAKLIRVTGNVEKATKGMGLAADIARARNISLEAATRLVERAQAGNANAFSRIGIKLKENQTATDALRIATERFGGSAEKYGKTAAGAQERLGVAFENLQEKIGQKLLPVAVKLSEWLLELIETVEREWPKWEKTIKDGVETAQRVFEDIRPVLEAFAKQIENIVKLVAAIFRGDWSEAWEKFKDVIAGAVTFWVRVFQEYLEKFKAAAKRLGEAVVNGVKDGLKGIVGEAWNLVLGIRDKITERLEAIKGWGEDVGIRIKNGVLAALGGIAGATWEVVKDIGAFYVDKYATILGWGKKIGTGIKDGIVDGLKGLTGLLLAAIKEAVNAMIRLINSVRIPGFSIDPLGKLGPTIKFGGWGGFNIPELAKGGIVTRPTLAMIGDGGPEAVVPLNRAGGMNGPMIVQLVLDGRVLAEQMIDHNRNAAQRFSLRNARSAYA